MASMTIRPASEGKSATAAATAGQRSAKATTKRPASWPPGNHSALISIADRSDRSAVPRTFLRAAVASRDRAPRVVAMTGGHPVVGTNTRGGNPNWTAYTVRVPPH